MLTNFFYTLTKDNWGWPYHLIISWFLVEFGFAVFGDIEKVVFVVFSIGVLYEAYQALKKENDWKDFWQDFIANILGISFGAIFSQLPPA